MSYDRVLPKPPALQYGAPQVTLPRQTSNLLEHKIMNNDVGGSCRYIAPQTHLSSINGTKLVLNKIALNASPKIVSPVPTVGLPIRNRTKRSSSSTPVKSAPPKDSVTKYCLCQPEPKIPRPRNVFMLFRQFTHAEIKAQRPGITNPEMSKVLGARWNALPEERKKEWEVLAQREVEEHRKKYPGYKYRPNRSGKKGGKGSSQRSSPDICHSPPSPTVCSQCGGHVINPVSPETPFTPKESSNSSGSKAIAVQSRQRRRAKAPSQPPSPIKIGSNRESHSPHRHQWEESGHQSPESKRRRLNPQGPFKTNTHLDIGPNSPYPMSTYTTRSDTTNSQGFLQLMHPPGGIRNSRQSPHDFTVKLPPLQTPASSGTVTPVSPSQDGSSLEATVMNIPILNKIRVIAKISPPLMPSFRDGPLPRRGPVIAVDGQDPVLVQTVVDCLNTALQKEGKYNARVFEGPDIHAYKSCSESGQIGDATVDYLKKISEWHRISDEIVNFVKPASEPSELESAEDDSSSGVSPKSSELKISSPAHSSENGTELPSSLAGVMPSSIPVALVPQYQITTADAFACSIPISGFYTPLDHWQWTASLWRACVGPDITVYTRDCDKDELNQVKGNPVEVCLREARTIVVRRVAGLKELEEKTLKRLLFEIEDYLTQ